MRTLVLFFKRETTKVVTTNWVCSQTFETILNQENSRYHYHRIEHDLQKIEKLFVDIFLQSYKKPPSQIILDMDVTDDQVHGNQSGAFFNTYYQGVCYTPLYFFWTSSIYHKKNLN